MKTSEFRKNVYNLLDQVIEKGEPLRIHRKGHSIKIVCEPTKSKLESLTKRNCMTTDPEDLVEIDWSIC